MPAVGLVAACAVATAFAAAPVRAVVDEPGPLTLSPAQVAIDRIESDEDYYELVADPTEPSETIGSRAEGEEQAETQPAAAAWPPGLLMKGLDAIGVGKPMQDLGLRLYGYVETGFTGLLHGGPAQRKQHFGPLPLRLFEAHKFNNLLLNQLKFTLDRPVDTSKSFDLGGRADFIFGSDARNIHSYGLLDEHSLEVSPNHPYPFNRAQHVDLQQAYGEMWIKTGCEPGQGLDVVFGKWVTTFGAEVIDGPSNYLYSRSMLFTYAIPFAHTGLKLTYYFNPTNNVYFAVVRGWDTFKDNNRGASWMSGFLWSSKDLCGTNPKTQLGFNFIGGPEQFSSPRFSGLGTWHNNPGNRYVWDAVWTYRYTEKLTQVVNGDIGFEEDVPITVNHNKEVRKRDANWYGVAYYLNYVFNDYVNATVRGEWFEDHVGARTGFQGDFYEVTTGVTITPFPCDPWLKDLIIRPEIRWDWSANNEPFAGEHSHQTWQMTAGIDLIYKF